MDHCTFELFSQNCNKQTETDENIYSYIIKHIPKLLLSNQFVDKCFQFVIIKDPNK